MVSVVVHTFEHRLYNELGLSPRKLNWRTRACWFSFSVVLVRERNILGSVSRTRAEMSEFLVNLLGERLVNSEKAEVDVQALGSKLSLVGLYFGCSLNGPCKQFNASLCEFYSKFKKSSEHKDKLEIVFVSSDQDQKHWQDFLQEMQWPALPFKDRHKKVSSD